MQTERITFSLKDRVPISEKLAGVKSGDRVMIKIEATVAEVAEESFDGVVSDVVSVEPSGQSSENAPIGAASVLYPS